MNRLKGLLMAVSLLLPSMANAGFTLSTDSLELEFSDQGDLVDAIACYPLCGVAVPTAERKQARFGGGEDAVIRLKSPSGDWTLAPSLQDGDTILRFEHPEGLTVSWRVPQRGYLLRVSVTGAATASGRAYSLSSGPQFRPRELAGFGNWLEQVRYEALPGMEMDFGGGRAGLDADADVNWQTDGWAGYRNRYWALMMRLEAGGAYAPVGGDRREDARVDVHPLQPEGTIEIYVGPLESGALAAADPALKDLQFGALWFWLRWVCFGMLWLLGVIHSGVERILPPSLSWGCSIILLSLAVHVLMRPLSRIADRFQHQVQETESRLAPELARIRGAHKGERQAEEILALYKREGVHPLYSLKSLLGVAVVIPVFIGAFDMLAENINLLHVGFLWIEDLSRPDAIAGLPFSIPFFGNEFNLLPVLMTGFSVLASWLHQPSGLHSSLRPRQVRNMLLLAALFFVLFYTFPSGMVLYWTMNNVISAARGGWQRWRQQPAIERTHVDG